MFVDVQIWISHGLIISELKQGVVWDLHQVFNLADSYTGASLQMSAMVFYPTFENLVRKPKIENVPTDMDISDHLSSEAGHNCI